MINTKKSKGFTLIELLVVVAIIGLLASIVIVSLGGVRRGGRDAKARADIRQIQTAIELCASTLPAGGYPDLTSALAGTRAVPVWTDVGAATSITQVGDGVATCGATVFMDPIPTTNGATGNNYEWDDYNDVTGYTIRTALELQGPPGGCFTVTETGITEIAGICL